MIHYESHFELIKVCRSWSVFASPELRGVSYFNSTPSVLETLDHNWRPVHDLRELAREEVFPLLGVFCLHRAPYFDQSCALALWFDRTQGE